MKDYDKNKESSYLNYWDIKITYTDRQCHKKLPVSGFKWVENIFQFSKDFIENYNEDSNEGYFPEVGVQYPEILHNLRNNLPFLPERMKIQKVETLVANLHDKKEYVIQIRNLKQALNHRLVLKKVHRVIKFDQEA